MKSKQSNAYTKTRHLSIICAILAVFLFYCIQPVESSNLRSSVTSEPFSWVENYFSWHANKREENLNDDNTKFLIIICHRNQRCGGIADRLKSLPYFLRLAEQTNRMLFIKWEKYNLEDFMQPPNNGFDWRLPDFVNMSENVDYDGSLVQLINNKDKGLHKQKDIFLSTHLEHVFELEFNYDPVQLEILHRIILSRFFEPVPSLQRKIQDTMDNLGLVPKKYVVAHYRSQDQLFFVENDTEPDENTEQMIQNAIKCALEKGGDVSLPVYFTSSNSQNVKYVLQRSPFAQDRNPSVKVIGLEYTRIHSEYPSKNYFEEQHDPSEFYPIFVDLWIMGYSKCVSFGNLGFGRLGARLSGSFCYVNHHQSLCHKPM